MLMKEVKEVVDTVSVALANGQPEEAGNVVMQEVNHALLSMGVDEAMADKIDNFIILLFIIGIALLANLICRKIILRTVAKLVRQTKATWDDIVFNDKVMVNISRMVAPILIYISIPIAFHPVEPMNPGPHDNTNLKESSSGFFNNCKYQVPFTLPVKILLKGKFRSVVTGNRPGNAQ